MSTPTYVQSNSVALAISQDSGVSYKNVVCKRSAGFNGTTPVNTEETDCGVAKGLGQPDWTMDFEGVVNTTPNGATELSASELSGLWLSQTQVLIKLLTPYVQGSGYITDYKTTYATGSLVAFSFTFNGVGNPDLTA